MSIASVSDSSSLWSSSFASAISNGILQQKGSKSRGCSVPTDISVVNRQSSEIELALDPKFQRKSDGRDKNPAEIPRKMY